MRPNHIKTVTVSNADMKQAILEGTWRQQSAVKNKSIARGAGDYGTHQRGRLAEIAFARYLGVEIPKWQWEEDKKRGCDLIGPDGTRYHIRSNKEPEDGLLIFPRDPTGGIYVHVTFCENKVRINGWYTRGEAERYHKIGTMRAYKDVQCWTIPQEDLYPFAASGYAA